MLGIFIGLLGLVLTAIGLALQTRGGGQAGIDRLPLIAIDQSTNVSKTTRITVNHYYSNAGSDEDPWGEIITIILVAFVSAMGVWALRPYLLAIFTVLLLATILLRLACPWVVDFEQQPPWVTAVLLIGLVILWVLIGIPGVMWGDHLRMSYSWNQALHLHGAWFFFSGALATLVASATTAAEFLHTLAIVVGMKTTGAVRRPTARLHRISWWAHGRLNFFIGWWLPVMVVLGVALILGSHWVNQEMNRSRVTIPSVTSSTATTVPPSTTP